MPVTRASLVVQIVKNLPAMQETWVQSQVGKTPWIMAWQPIPVLLPMDRGACQAKDYGVAKSQTHN